MCQEEKCLHVYYIYYTTDIIYLCIILQTSIPSTIYISISGYTQSTLGFIIKLTPIDYEQTSFCIRSPQLTAVLGCPRQLTLLATSAPCWHLEGTTMFHCRCQWADARRGLEPPSVGCVGPSAFTPNSADAIGLHPQEHHHGN